MEETTTVSQQPQTHTGPTPPKPTIYSEWESAFPGTPRDEQRRFCDDWYQTIKDRKTMLAHAPTGLGKTLGALVPAISYALQHGMRVLYVTPRISQHKQVIRELSRIKHASGKQCTALSYIGRNIMCARPDRPSGSHNFAVFCDKERKTRQCVFHKNSYSIGSNEIREEAGKLIHKIIAKGVDSGDFKRYCEQSMMCPAYLQKDAMGSADLIIVNTVRIIDPAYRERFIDEAKIVPSKTILIYDEAHKIPDAIKSLYDGEHLSPKLIDEADKEIAYLKLTNAHHELALIKKDVNRLFKQKSQIILGAADHQTPISIGDLPSINTHSAVDRLREIVEEETQSRSGEFQSLNSLLRFVNRWRVEEQKVPFRCIEVDTMKPPSRSFDIKSAKVKNFNLAVSLEFQGIAELGWHATLITSGTLSPLIKYKAQLGYYGINVVEESYASPFDPANKAVYLNSDDKSTAYKGRGEKLWEAYAVTISSMINKATCNVAVFFTSYAIQRAVLKEIEDNNLLDSDLHNVFIEVSGMDSRDRQSLLKSFKNSSELKTKGVLFGVFEGSFDEGVDFPGKELECVIVCGAPYARKNLRMQREEEYMDRKHYPGFWAKYGYKSNVVMRVIQAAGRLIRNESDRGVLVLLDARYRSDLRSLLPPDWNVRITTDAEIVNGIKHFFSSDKNVSPPRDGSNL